MKRYALISLFTLAGLSAPEAQASNFQLAFPVSNLADALGAAESADGIGSAVLSRGPGLIADTSFPGFYDSYGWSASVSFPGSSNDEYLSLTINLSPGYTATYDNLKLAYSTGGSALAPRSLEIRSSDDSFTSSLFVDDTVGASIEFHTIDLSGLGTQNAGSSLEFRLWGFDSPGGISDDSNAIFGLANSPALLVSAQEMAVILEGSVVPEPSNVTLFLPLASVLLVCKRRTRRHQTRNMK